MKLWRYLWAVITVVILSTCFYLTIQLERTRSQLTKQNRAIQQQEQSLAELEQTSLACQQELQVSNKVLSHVAFVVRSADGRFIEIRRNNGQLVSKWEPKESKVYQVLDKALPEGRNVNKRQ